MITNYGGKLSACIKACREGGRVRAAFMKREPREGVKERGRLDIIYIYIFLNLAEIQTFSLFFLNV